MAQAGYDPESHEQVGARGAGISWRARILRARDRLLPAEAHYVRHVLVRHEWPPGTTVEAYLDSPQQAAEDNNGGIFLSMYGDAIQARFVSLAERWRGPAGAT